MKKSISRFILLFAFISISLLSISSVSAICPQPCTCPPPAFVPIPPAETQKGLSMPGQPQVSGGIATYTAGTVDLQAATVAAPQPVCGKTVQQLDFQNAGAIAGGTTYQGTFHSTVSKYIWGSNTERTDGWDLQDPYGYIGEDGSFKGGATKASKGTSLILEEVPEGGDFPVQGEYIFKGDAASAQVNTLLNLKDIKQAIFKEDLSCIIPTAASAELKGIEFTTIADAEFDQSQNLVKGQVAKLATPNGGDFTQFEGEVKTTSDVKGTAHILLAKGITYTDFDGTVSADGEVEGSATLASLADGTQIQGFDGKVDASGQMITIQSADSIIKGQFNLESIQNIQLSKSMKGLTLACQGCSIGKVSNTADPGHTFTVGSASGQIIIEDGADQKYWAKLSGTVEAAETHLINFQADRKIEAGIDRLIYYDEKTIAKGLVGGKEGKDFVEIIKQGSSFGKQIAEILGGKSASKNPSLETQGSSIDYAYTEANGLKASVDPQGNGLARAGNIATEGCDKISLDLTQPPLLPTELNCLYSKVTESTSKAGTQCTYTQAGIPKEVTCNGEVYIASTNPITKQTGVQNIVDDLTASKILGSQNTLAKSIT